MAAFSWPDRYEPHGLQCADHLRPGHLEIVNLPVGFVNALDSCYDGVFRFLSAAAVIWMAVAFVACYLPASCASRVDPMEALRHE